MDCDKTLFHCRRMPYSFMERNPIGNSMIRIKTLFFLALAFLSAPFRIPAAPEKPIIRFTSLSIQGLGSEEGRIIESLILSYLTAMGTVMLSMPSAIAGSFDKDMFIPMRESLVPDFTLSGSVTLEQNSRVLTLEIGKPAASETLTYTSRHKTTGELVLKARGLVESAFSGSAEMEGMGEKQAEPLSEAAVLGAWKGDRNIELVRLRQGGRGIAIFSSGVQMHLRYAIKDNALQVIQDSPNTERYYHPTPYAVAKELVGKTEPMRWELLLYDQGNALRGIKITTGARYEGNVIVELFPGAARDAEWIRVAH